MERQRLPVVAGVGGPVATRETLAEGISERKHRLAWPVPLAFLGPLREDFGYFGSDLRVSGTS